MSEEPNYIFKKKGIITLVVIIIAVILSCFANNHFLFSHTSCMEAYHLEIEYLELRTNENVSCFEVSMIDEVLFIAHFELNSEVNYVIHYGHLEGKFVIDTQTIVLNRSIQEYFKEFYFHDEALIGLYSTSYFCSNEPIALIHINLISS